MTTNCPTPDKRRYQSKGKAIRVLRGMYQTGNGEADLQVYRCRCGVWHIGHRGQDYGRTKVALKALTYRRRGQK